MKLLGDGYTNECATMGIAMLKIAIYDGDFFGDMTELTHVCELEGSIEAHDSPPFNTLEETLCVLEMNKEGYTIPRLIGPCFTVFIGRVSNATLTPLVRLDGYAHNGWASAHVRGASAGWTTEPVYYTPEDDAVTILRRILTGPRTP